LSLLYKNSDYASALTLLAGLSSVIDAYFDKVMVMDDDPEIRGNRLTLLAELKSMFDHVANLALVG
jgi:glycyl-tRNA synthetase beta chain